jgi:hypothetical protein
LSHYCRQTVPVDSFTADILCQLSHYQLCHYCSRLYQFILLLQIYSASWVITSWSHYCSRLYQLILLLQTYSASWVITSWVITAADCTSWFFYCRHTLPVEPLPVESLLHNYIYNYAYPFYILCIEIDVRMQTKCCLIWRHHMKSWAGVTWSWVSQCFAKTAPTSTYIYRV